MTNTTSFPLSKELKELGLKSEIKCGDYAYLECCNELHLIHKDYVPRLNDVKWIKAYSTDELLAILPENLDQRAEYYKKNLYIIKSAGSFRVFYGETGVMHNHKLLPEVLGLTCKYLLQSGYEFNGKEIVRKGEK